jgi:hypothetical protein
MLMSSPVMARQRRRKTSHSAASMSVKIGPSSGDGLRTVDGHQAEHPFREGFAADKHDLPAARVMAHQIEKTLQAGAVGADRLLAELLDIDAVSIGIDLVDHAGSSLSRCFLCSASIRVASKRTCSNEKLRQ